jgi:hypothetical protein
MTSLELRKLFAYHAEEAEYRNWSQGAREVKSVFACEYGTIWKFTPKEWWQFVKKAIGNQGSHDFLLSRALLKRPKHIQIVGTAKRGNRKIFSSDNKLRCVNPLDWTIEDWNNEMMRLRGFELGTP